MKYDIQNDFRSIRELLGLSLDDFAEAVGTAKMTVIRWEKGLFLPSAIATESVYSYAFSNPYHPLRLNALKAELRKDDKVNRVLLFHGAKGEIVEPIDTGHTVGFADFGNGFYAGESLEQAETWVAGEPNSSVYLLYFSPENFKGFKIEIGIDWMLAVAYYRGKLDSFKNKTRVMRIIREIEQSDYVIAPIADNQMYKTINDFINGFITTEQCLHCLSATTLGYQYVFRTNSVCKGLTLLDRLYLCKKEKEEALSLKSKLSQSGLDKVQMSLRQYRGKGVYIEDLLK
jgi:DNA-binding XRE family transcriptional regulator